jgi:hypothetical protein
MVGSLLFDRPAIYEFFDRPAFLSTTLLTEMTGSSFQMQRQSISVFFSVNFDQLVSAKK